MNGGAYRYGPYDDGPDPLAAPYDAGAVGSWLHGAAATLASAGGPTSAPDVAAALPRVIADLLA